jgi:hypothetical protein
MNSKMPEYQSGSCNIGGAEVRRRKVFGIISGVAAVAFCILAIILHAPRGIRVLVFFPLVSAAIGWFQSRRRFCLAFGFSGIFNFGNLGEVSRVLDPAQRAADRAQALRILARATIVAALSALILTVIPV